MERVKLDVSQERIDIWAVIEKACGGHVRNNAVRDRLNSKVQTIKKMACDFQNQENFKTAIYFHCGGLQLYPVTQKKAG